MPVVRRRNSLLFLFFHQHLLPLAFCSPSPSLSPRLLLLPLLRSLLSEECTSPTFFFLSLSLSLSLSLFAEKERTSRVTRASLSLARSLARSTLFARTKERGDKVDFFSTASLHFFFESLECLKRQHLLPLLLLLLRVGRRLFRQRPGRKRFLRRRLLLLLYFFQSREGEDIAFHFLLLLLLLLEEQRR